MKSLLIRSIALLCSVGFAGIASAVTTDGTYTLYYDWNCNGGYSSTSVTLSVDGTFTAGSYSGNWVENNQTLTLTYSSGTYYTGYHTSEAVVGVQRSYNGLDGCFYMLKSSTVALKQAQSTAVDSDGR
ncbi:hypothetical protein [Vibrio mangrovi]|uniref:Uncharacterized protein n=1 Tax=Vibrio mangrovi TaxID=474394 RepID=A0A1Y6IX57_9VIBR|nr:hypothetical protein [Vibrio mangrovi]MDW6002757.1 hypothetical protein [Vibrio mangrovi]SMS02249.1 hypothetical protein VIM7927_03568 [Vibrio mangrovi]